MMTSRAIAVALVALMASLAPLANALAQNSASMTWKHQDGERRNSAAIRRHSNGEETRTLEVGHHGQAIKVDKVAKQPDGGFGNDAAQGAQGGGGGGGGIGNTNAQGAQGAQSNTANANTGTPVDAKNDASDANTGTPLDANPNGNNANTGTPLNAKPNVNPTAANPTGNNANTGTPLDTQPIGNAANANPTANNANTGTPLKAKSDPLNGGGAGDDDNDDEDDEEGGEGDLSAPKAVGGGEINDTLAVEDGPAPAPTVVVHKTVETNSSAFLPPSPSPWYTPVPTPSPVDISTFLGSPSWSPSPYPVDLTVDNATCKDASKISVKDTRDDMEVEAEVVAKEHRRIKGGWSCGNKTLLLGSYPNGRLEACAWATASNASCSNFFQLHKDDYTCSFFTVDTLPGHSS